MIPHVIHIKNFLSYGQETQIIDFRPYNLISLCGKNGHGKSALLDAITWAIWGQARKSSGQSKPDAGLMHLGQKHMMVILEFEVNKIIYRVRREYLHTQSKPFATLDFGVAQDDGKITPLTDKTIKDTQDKIERTIGITYESFANSTFLRQGQSNEFSKKSPKERKEILAQILQLQRFEYQKKLALAHVRKLNQEYQTQLQITGRIDQELKDLACVPEQLSTAQQQLDTIQAKIILINQNIEQLNKQQQECNTQQNQVAFLKKQIEEITVRYQEILKKIQLHQQQQAATTTTNKKDLQTLEQTLFTQLDIHQKAQQEKLQLKEQYLLIKDGLTKKIQTLQQEHNQQSQVLQTMAATCQEAYNNATKQLDQINKRIDEQANHIKKSDQQFKDFSIILQSSKDSAANYQKYKTLLEQHQQSYQQICSQGTYFKQHIQKINDDITKIESPQHQHCLLCQQSITNDQKQHIHQTLDTQIIDINATLITLKQSAQTLKQEITTTQNIVLEHEKLYQTHLQTQAKFDQQQQLHTTLLEQHKNLLQQHQQVMLEQTNHAQALTNTTKQLQQLEQDFQQQLKAADIVKMQEQLTNIEQQAKKLTCLQPPEYIQLEQQLTQVRTTLQTMENQDLLIKQQMEYQQLLKQDAEEKQHLQKLEQELLTFAHVPEKLQKLKQQELQELEEKKIISAQQEHLFMQIGSLQQKQNKQKDLQKELEVIATQSKTLFQELSDYQEIAKALGKDGIQALLIEQAIPEIEDETNQILARLTNNQTQIFIESLRDLKKGGSKETLDIKIADPFGIRDYEMFSGGEAFRIDFALRIGISKLLARRAGTTLQTIFIDEGFGSQDEEGLQLIMDNIHKIQDDFAKIIVVSHLPEMKEHFPVQFVVEKKRSGSTISIMHQG